MTKSDAELIHKCCDLEKIHIIPNGVDINKFRPLRIEEVPYLLLWCGRFVQQKGLKYLIESLRIIVKKWGRTEIKLVMTGDGPLLSKIYGMVKRYGIMDNVVFMGRIPRDEIPIIMNKAAVYVLPSIYEGMPYVLLEAMACGKPVIGSDIPGINDVITHGENGILVPPRKPKALANAILMLLNDKKLRRKLGWNARQLMIKKYSWNVISKMMEKIYYEVISQNK